MITMATERNVTCINKSDRNSIHEQIVRLGGTDANGYSWKSSQLQVITDIENGTYRYYVSRNGTKAKVVVAVSAAGNKYLKTEADSTTSNNLLSLPECP